MGIGLICACLPPLNALIGRRRSPNSSKNMMNTPEHELSRISGTVHTAKGGTNIHDREVESDKDYLITNAQLNGGYETSVHRDPTARVMGHATPGIVKTVDVSHAYERR